MILLAPQMLNVDSLDSTVLHMSLFFLLRHDLTELSLTSVSLKNKLYLYKSRDQLSLKVEPSPRLFVEAMIYVLN